MAVKRGFMDGYKTYDDSQGYGNSKEWRSAFSERMGRAEAEVIIKGQKRTLWQILGLTSGINHSQEVIKAAFRKKAFELHPDRHLQNGMTIAQATEAFKELMAAYTILKR